MSAHAETHPAYGRVQVVWLKRDLRLRDHEPLFEAAQRGPVVALYVDEPELIQTREYDGSHHVFIGQCLRELDRKLRERGGRLTVRLGEVAEVLDGLHRELAPLGGVAHLWAHQETGQHVTYMRDLRVLDWARARGVPFTECFQHGIVRRLRSRDGWAAKWQKRMNRPLVPEPQRLTPLPLDVLDGWRGHGQVRDVEDLPPGLGLAPSTRSPGWVQRGGEDAAWDVLKSFLSARGVGYRKDMSSPVEGWEGCSRLSTYLAWGAISGKAVHQATRRAQDGYKAAKEAGRKIDSRWLPSLRSFQGRLRWRDHFAQKLEDEPSLEFLNLNRAFDGLRDETPDEALVGAWIRGETGYPMVDACMRCLHATGWVNFRMRAMLVSFVSYHLWQHWREPALQLAPLFLDYEPGIHYPQFQMQAGTTGINAVRIYSPRKQVEDQDPQGVFIKRWVPELEPVPPEHLAEPHTMPPLLQRAVGCVVGKDYPEPIVDHGEAYNAAKKQVFAWRRRPEVRAASQQVFDKHGSRRRPRDRNGRGKGRSGSGGSRRRASAS